MCTGTYLVMHMSYGWYGLWHPYGQAPYPYYGQPAWGNPSASAAATPVVDPYVMGQRGSSLYRGYGPAPYQRPYQYSYQPPVPSAPYPLTTYAPEYPYHMPQMPSIEYQQPHQQIPPYLPFWCIPQYFYYIPQYVYHDLGRMPWQQYYRQQFPTQLPQQNMHQYMQPSQPVSYSRPSMQGMPMHVNCVHFSNGICTLGGTLVPPNGAACPSFTPRY